jgi:DNA-binding transcriptional regulator GbsR (MarR family)
MSNEGYIKLYHSFLDWEWYLDLNVQAVFLHLLLTVNHREVKFQGKIFKKGSRRVSNSDIADETGLSIQNVKTAINKLESSGYIKKELVKGVNLIIVPDIAQARPGSYVKLYRKFTSWEWYKHKKEKAIYVYSLLHARRFTVEESGLILKVGSYSKNFTEIAKDLRLSIKNVRTAFKNLTMAEDLRTTAGHKIRVISVCKYVDYHKYEEDTNLTLAAGSDTNLENIKNSGGITGRRRDDVSIGESDSYNLSGLPGSQLLNLCLNSDQTSPKSLSNKRDKSVERERVQEKESKSYADALESTSVDISLGVPDMDEFLKDSGLLTDEEKRCIREEVYKALPKDSIKFFRNTVRSTFGLEDDETVEKIKHEVFDFQVDCYLDSIEMSSNNRSLDAIIKWTTYRYRSKYYQLNILQDTAAYLIFETYSVVVPIDSQIRRRFIKCLDTLAKRKISDYELYNFIHWCRTTGFPKKTPTLDVVQDYLFNSRELAKLMANYLR